MNISKAQYKKALQADGILTEKSHELLNLLYEAPKCEATSAQLAERLGYNDFAPVNSMIGKLGKRFAKELNITLPERKNKSRGWWQLILSGDETEYGFAWRLKEELFAALVELDLLQGDGSDLYPEVIDSNETLSEGKKKSIKVNTYERNGFAREICIKHYGTSCSVCNLNFEDVYGNIGKGFIHVHHLTELSTIEDEYQVNPIKDLRPVCPNCHAMLHQRKPAYLIEELKAIINSKK